MTLATCHPQRLHKGRGLCGACYDKWLKSVNAEYRARQRDNDPTILRRIAVYLNRKKVFA